jgi:hypothetical protein
MEENNSEAPADVVVPPVEDPVKQVKEEFNRKLGNVNESLQAIMQKLEAASKPAARETEEADISELLYQNPRAYTAEIERRAIEKASAAVESRVEARMSNQQAVTNVIAELGQKFPELADQESPAFKTAVEKFNALPKIEQGKASAIRLALLESVAEHGLIAASKRKTSQNDDFSLSGQRSQSGKRPGNDPSRDIDSKTLEIARLMGLDTSDKKTLEGLKSRQKGR